MTGETLAALGGVALFAGAGLGIAELLPGLRALSPPRRLGYAYVLGVAWIAGGLYALSHLGRVPLGRPAVLALAAPATLAGLAQRLRGGAAAAPRRRRRPAALEWMALAAAAIVTLGILGDALTNPLRDWDGRMTWAAQARYVRAAGTVDAPVLRDPRGFVTHPRYPLLLPLAQVAVLDLAGSRGDDFPFRATYAAFFPAFLLLVYDGARRWAGRRAAALATLAAALVPFPAFSPEGGATTAYSDLPLACFYGAALLLLLRRPPRLSQGIAAGLLFAAAALAKQEGAPLAVWALVVSALALGFSIARWRGLRGLAPHGVAALLLGAALALLVSWAAAIPERYDEDYAGRLSLHALGSGIVARAPLVLAGVRAKMVSFENWTIFWWMTPVVWLAGRRGLARRVALPLALAAAAPLALAWIAYGLDDDPLPLVLMTWNRFLLQAGIPLFLLLALALRSVLGCALPGRRPAGAIPPPRPGSPAPAPPRRSSAAP
jgi:hypothetical protein